MADKIVQTFAVDASQALRGLELLDQGFAKLETRINSVAGAISGMNKTTKSVTNLGTAFKSNIPDAVNHTERLTTSLGLLSRVVFTQSIVRGLNIIRNQFQETAADAAEFQRRVALITTIGDGAKFQDIAIQVRRLSDEFNIPLLESAQGVYNALSNQVGNFGESVKFAEEAARFAKATNSSLADSVDLLSAALKGYGLTVNETDRVSAIFFSAIDKGRITASELANSFGRIDTIASDLGVSLPEVAGALASVSVRGTKTSEALTQVRAILSALQKPSEDMERRLREFGFTSAETAIKTRGLAGLLDDLVASTGGSAEELAKLFRNIRGLAGATSLGGDIKTLTDSIRDMDNAGRDFADSKFLQATATDAEKVSAEFNKMKNTLTVELGQQILSLTNSFFKLTNGADGVTAAAKVAIPTLASLGTGLATLKGGAIATEAGFVGLGKAINALALLQVGAGVGASIGTFIEDRRVKALFAELNKLEALNKRIHDQFAKEANDAADKSIQADDRRVKAALAFTQQLNRIYLRDVENKTEAEKKKERAELEAAERAEAHRRKVFEQFTRATPFDENQLGVLLGKGINAFSTPDEVQSGLIEAQNRVADLTRQLAGADVAADQAKRLSVELQSLFANFDPTRSFIPGLEAFPQFSQDAKFLTANIKLIGQSTAITEDEVTKLIVAYNALANSAKGDILGSAASSNTLNVLERAIQKIQQIQQLQAQTPNTDFLRQERDVLRDFLTSSGPANGVADGLKRALDNAAAIERESRKTAENYERAINALNSGALTDVRGLSRAFGGPAYLASGGLARGLDQIPALLSKGEYVINPKSTQRYFSQLQAMNAGQTPVFRQEGGNVTIGDINLTVKGGDSSEATVRTISQGLKREFRRRGAII